MPNIILPVSFESQPDETIQLFAYAFTRSGKLLDRQEVKAGKASFKDFGIPGQDIRFFILPAGAGGTNERPVKTLQDLEKLSAYEPIMKWDKNTLITLPIPDKFPLLWKWVFCRVLGRVQKRFDILGLSQDRGLCHARVHICEVDRLRFWIDLIPDDVIIKIPDVILKPEIPIRKPIPIPDPAPFTRIALPVQRSAGSTNLFQVLSAKAVTASGLQAAPALDKRITSALATRNVKLIRSTILDNFQLLHPYFCYYPFFWPWLYRHDEIRTVYTDMNGRFDTTITYLAGNDIPDLYFWVEYLINGVWTTVYKPSVPCNTYWDYKCGTEVVLRVTDERVRWECSETLPGEVIWLKSVGHSVSVSHIRQDHLQQATNNTPAVNTDRIGMTDASVANGTTAPGDFKRPFGSSIYFLMQFSSGLPKAGINYYKWKWCKTHNANLSVLNASPADADFTPLTTPISKSYTFEYTDMFGFKHFDANSVKLGPLTVGTQTGLYQIPPVNPAMAPFNVPESSPQWDQNTVSMVIDTNALQGDGLYEFRLEIYNSAGILVTGLPRQLFQVPHVSTFTPSVFAPDAMLSNLAGANADGMRMVLRVDNQVCEGALYKIKKNGTEVTTDCCGFVNYGTAASNLEVSFKASHPNNLAEFGFTITKGTCVDAAMTNQTQASGWVIGDANGYTRDGASIYHKTFQPPALLGICNGGGKAAFAENLSVVALATDGNYRLSSYDDYDVAAFALEP